MTLIIRIQNEKQAVEFPGSPEGEKEAQEFRRTHPEFKHKQIRKLIQLSPDKVPASISGARVPTKREIENVAALAVHLAFKKPHASDEESQKMVGDALALHQLGVRALRNAERLKTDAAYRSGLRSGLEVSRITSAAEKMLKGYGLTAKLLTTPPTRDAPFCLLIPELPSNSKSGAGFGV